MLKDSSTRRAAMDEDRALGIGVGAIQFLAGEPELLRRFLHLSGLSVEQLRQEAQHPSFFAGLLDFFLDHEPTLNAFVASASLAGDDVVAARSVLAKASSAAPR